MTWRSVREFQHLINQRYIMAISAQDVKSLRDRTGAGMADCKKALEEAAGDMEGAIEVLRKKGAATAAKRADKAANEGVVSTAISDDRHRAAIVEVNCETDFVARNEEFSSFTRNLAKARQRDLKAMVWRFPKRSLDYRVTITDAKGIVIYDSLGRDLGRDNSRWNDVYRTLRGEYGARSSPEVPGEEGDTVMHVAAPVYDPADGRTLIGVLSLAQPNRSIDPFIAASQRAIRYSAIGAPCARVATVDRSRSQPKPWTCSANGRLQSRRRKSSPSIGCASPRKTISPRSSAWPRRTSPISGSSGTAISLSG